MGVLCRNVYSWKIQLLVSLKKDELWCPCGKVTVVVLLVSEDHVLSPGVMLPVNRAPQGLVAAVSYKHTSVATSQSYRDGLP